MGWRDIAGRTWVKTILMGRCFCSGTENERAPKWLSMGKLKWWPKEEREKLSAVGAWELQLLLWNGNTDKARFSEPWRPLLIA